MSCADLLMLTLSFPAYPDCAAPPSVRPTRRTGPLGTLLTAEGGLHVPSGDSFQLCVFLYVPPPTRRVCGICMAPLGFRWQFDGTKSDHATENTEPTAYLVFSLRKSHSLEVCVCVTCICLWVECILTGMASTFQLVHPAAFRTCSHRFPLHRQMSYSLITALSATAWLHMATFQQKSKSALS